MPINTWFLKRPCHPSHHLTRLHNVFNQSLTTAIGKEKVDVIKKRQNNISVKRLTGQMTTGSWGKQNVFSSRTCSGTVTVRGCHGAAGNFWGVLTARGRVGERLYSAELYAGICRGTQSRDLQLTFKWFHFLKIEKGTIK